MDPRNAGAREALSPKVHVFYSDKADWLDLGADLVVCARLAPDRQAAPVARELVKTGKPMLAHVGFGSHGDFGALLRVAPGLKLILAHAGFPEYSDTWEKIRGNKNVFVDLSQTGYVGEKTTRQVIEYLGVERCLFGTDGPFGYHAADGKMDYGFIRRRIDRLIPDAGARRRILGENFAVLAGIV
mgnify:CR=1 FL=1